MTKDLNQWANRGMAAAMVLSLSACGGNMVARDALVEDKGAEAFLDRVAHGCARESIGNDQLHYLVEESSDSYFIDLTTKLYFGQISRAQYTSDIDSFYPTGANQAGIDCIFSQLP